MNEPVDNPSDQGPATPENRANRNRSAYDGRPRQTRAPKRRKTVNPVVRMFWRFVGALSLVFGGIWRQCRRFFSNWGTRKWKHLLQGLPALLLFLGVLGLSTATALQRDKLIPEYKKIAEVASADGKLDEALLFWRRLLNLDGKSPETVFAYAKDLSRRASKTAEAGKENVERGKELIAKGDTTGQELVDRGEQDLQTAEREGLDSQSLIEQISPPDTQGLPAAHLHRAKLMLSEPRRFLLNEDGTLNPESIKILHHHLLAAEKGMPDDIEVQMGFFYYFLGMNQFREAAAYLEKVARTRPHLRYELTNLYFRMGEREDALRNMKLASDFYEEQVRANPDNHELRARCASLRLNQGDLDGCIRMLEFGHTSFTGEKSPYPALLAQTHVSIYDALTSKGTESIDKRLAHLRASLSYLGDYQPALVRMIQFVSVGGEEGKEIEGYLQTMIAEGRMPATGHFALGTKAWQDKNIEKALWHLERAYELDPSLGHVGNNLAWILAEKDPPDLDRSLQIIDSVLAKWPNVPTYRDTRGQIYFKQGQWEKSLADLELALPYMRDNIAIHQTLARVYEQLGRTELASEHERIVEKLTTAAKVKDQTNPAFEFGSDIPDIPTTPK